MKHFASVRALGILACLLLLLAAGAFPASENRVAASQTNCSDTDIADRVNAALRRGIFNLPGVLGARATVSNRVVTVTGGVNSSADKRLITTIVIIAAQPCGIKNENVITGEIACPGDNRIEKRVREFLARALPCPVSSAIIPGVSVSGGVVTLNGSVSAEKYKDAAERAVKVFDCVQGVTNKLTVDSSAASSGDCSLTGRPLKKMIVDAIRARVTCGSGFTPDMVQVNGSAVRLVGSSAFDGLFLEIAKSVCPSLNITNEMTHIGPECPPGSIPCLGVDGEEFCCTGCRSCPEGG